MSYDVARTIVGDGWQDSVRWSHSPRATVVHKLAEIEAERLGQVHPSQAHILLALITEGHGIPMHLFIELGVDVTKVREDLINELDVPDEMRETYLRQRTSYEQARRATAGFEKDDTSVSGTVAIHVLTGSGRLRAHGDRIRSQVRAATGGALAHLSVDGEVDVVVRDDPRRVIPEWGIGGFAPDGHTVFVALDPDHERFEWAVERGLFATLAHELHHVARHQACGYGDTLFDALVSEGLADHFSIEVTGVEAPPWTVALTPEQAAELAARAREEYDDAYNHWAWFFGSDELGIPRWTGYTLGFQLVGDYLDRHPAATASALATAPSVTLRPSS
jgi:hypothetical protein